MDLTAAAIAQAERARRAETEADRLHRWIDAGCPPPPPKRPWWAPPSPYREDSPWPDIPEQSGSH